MDLKVLGAGDQWLCGAGVLRFLRVLLQLVANQIEESIKSLLSMHVTSVFTGAHCYQHTLHLHNLFLSVFTLSPSEGQHWSFLLIEE